MDATCHPHPIPRRRSQSALPSASSSSPRALARGCDGRHRRIAGLVAPSEKSVSSIRQAGRKPPLGRVSTPITRLARRSGRRWLPALNTSGSLIRPHDSARGALWQVCTKTVQFNLRRSTHAKHSRSFMRELDAGTTPMDSCASVRVATIACCSGG